MLAEKYPLYWPTGYPRTKWIESSKFGNHSFAKARDTIFSELNLLLDYNERKTIVLSTNLPLRLDGIPYANMAQPQDKGIAVYFQYKNESVVLCCDKWNKVEHNMWSVAQTINALRGIERWGVSDFLKRSFTGFNTLPPKQEKKEWWLVFKYQSKPGTASWDWEGVQAQYKSLAKQYHPDVAGGSTELFQELNNAYEEATKYFGK